MKTSILSIFISLLLQINLLANDDIKIFTEHYPPYNMKNEDGKIIGSSVEILNLILKEINSNQNIDDVYLTNWSRGYSTALKRKNTMIFSTTRTKGREDLFKWVGPIAKVEVGIIAPKRKNIKIHKTSDLKKYKIGAVLKDVGELLLLEQGVEKKNIENVAGDKAINLSFKKMEKNRIDMFSYNTTVAFENARNEGFDTSKYEVVHILSNSALYFAFNKNTDDKIIKKWQKALDKIRTDGTYDKILKKYRIVN
jgi:polar amino acid transport system substrate-binding protein